MVHIARLGGGTANYKRIEKPDSKEVVSNNIFTTNQEQNMEENMLNLDECDPLDIDEEEIGALLELDLEHEVQLVSLTGILENPLVDIPDSSAAPQKEIEDLFLEFESDEDCPETPNTPDLIWVVDDDLLK
jgi:hypothetical protein